MRFPAQKRDLMGPQYTTLGVTQYTQLPPLKHFRYSPGQQ